jgi:pyruvate dehydrogenase E2 component (dihydrolipoamide acetyltransferase)
VKEVIMPALGMAQETGKLIKWLKQPGEQVVKGEPLMEVETDKTTVEVEAPASGVLADVNVQPDQDVPVGRVIAVIVEANELSDKSQEPRAKNQEPSASPIAARMAAEHGIELSQITPKGEKITKEDVLALIEADQRERTLASPLARRLARENQLDIAIVKATGPDGAVIAQDIQLAIGDRRSAGVSEQSSIVNHQSPIEEIPMSRMWQVMVERLSEAWRTIPHIYLKREANASRLNAWRELAMKHMTEKITITDLLVKLAAASLRAHPRVNASWRDGKIIANADVNVGLAVAVEDGLVVPVIHQADTLKLSQIAARRKELVDRSKANKLTLNDLSGGTFTISNLGMYGVEDFNAIVNPPQAVILAVGAIVERLVLVGGQPVSQPMMTLSLSCDHRVVDGARGAQFLQTLVEFIEEPMRLLE